MALGWETPVSVSTVGDTIVATEGDLVIARNIGELVTRTINGVGFTGVVNVGDFDQGQIDSEIYTDGGVGSDFIGLMSSIGFESGNSTPTIPLLGLTPGWEYLLQVFTSNDRNIVRTRQVSHAVAGFESSATAYSQSFSRIARFVATANSETLSFANSLGSAMCNGYQLRQITSSELLTNETQLTGVPLA